MSIPRFPNFEPISLEMRDELHPRLSNLEEGISEYTFAGLYLFRREYRYELAWLPEGTLVISGEKKGKQFFMLPCGPPQDKGILKQLLESHDYIKGLAEPHADAYRVELESMGYAVIEDRDNFDYLYLRSDLAALQGKKYHKKRNLVNSFVNNYDFEERFLGPDNLDDAFYILDKWREEREDEGDYPAAREELELYEELGLKGYLVYVDEKPAAYTLGEPLARGRSFAVHYEKGINDYKGIYQFINRAFAAVLPRHYQYINREQDLGDPGLRQAKMTYRPQGFVKKYQVWSADKIRSQVIPEEAEVRETQPA